MLRNSSPFLLLRVRQQGKMGERECCNTTITFTKNNIVAVMIRNITLNNRTLLLGGGVREQIDNVSYGCRSRTMSVKMRFHRRGVSVGLCSLVGVSINVEREGSLTSSLGGILHNILR